MTRRFVILPLVLLFWLLASLASADVMPPDAGRDGGRSGGGGGCAVSPATPSVAPLALVGLVGLLVVRRRRR